MGVYRRGGLKVYTTIDPKQQDVARNAINQFYGDPAGPASAIASIDPHNGEIKAMASSGTYKDRRFNLAAQGHRQPGSAFKTMVLTAAVRAGIDPDSTSYTSKPLNLNVPGYGPWQVKTFSNTYGGTMSLVRATLSSDNSVYAQLILDVGPEEGVRDGQAAGHQTKLDCYPAEGAGRPAAGRDPAGDGERLRHAGHRRRPSQGHRHPQGGVPRRQVRGPGQLQGQARAHRRPGLRGHEDPQAERAAAAPARAPSSAAPPPARRAPPTASKDAWFVGYTPDLATSVWVGYPNANIAMAGGQGGTLAAPVFGAYMRNAHGDKCNDFPQPKQAG